MIRKFLDISWYSSFRGDWSYLLSHNLLPSLLKYYGWVLKTLHTKTFWHVNIFLKNRFLMQTKDNLVKRVSKYYACFNYSNIVYIGSPLEILLRAVKLSHPYNYHFNTSLFNILGDCDTNAKECVCTGAELGAKHAKCIDDTVCSMWCQVCNLQIKA